MIYAYGNARYRRWFKLKYSEQSIRAKNVCSCSGVGKNCMCMLMRVQKLRVRVLTYLSSIFHVCEATKKKCHACIV